MSTRDFLRADWIGPRASAFLMKHGVAVIVGGLLVLSVPAYIAAMELQAFDLEAFLALCGFPGFGRGG